MLLQEERDEYFRPLLMPLGFTQAECEELGIYVLNNIFGALGVAEWDHLWDPSDAIMLDIMGED